MAVLRPSLMRLLLGAALVLTPPAVLAQAPSAPEAPGGSAPTPESAQPAPATAKPVRQAHAVESGAAAAGSLSARPQPEAAAPGAEPPAAKASDSAPSDAWEDPSGTSGAARSDSRWEDPLAGTPEGAGEEQESTGWMLFRTLMVLGAVVASIYLTLNVGLRRLMGLQAVSSGRQPLVTVVERLPLDQRRTLFVVKAADEYLLVGGGEAGLQLLSKLDPEAVERIRAQRPQPSAIPMSPFLQKLLSRRSGGSPSQPPGA